ncbi:uncharacterized protein LOC111715752 [Eurytemora carolleeae]|uniref:uncharacterized protein LOC111715752 n=1 Tax=Eurytemora carolleeae TaxID=1294199 RepID=UPI000C7636D4|nr:uncharacterized protein LOC111715752 [Eurytemora carolleeae]|eukprot:XP_023346891.1 uncharacterized protein LOC111715752 [Eurytemora affinis]
MHQTNLVYIVPSYIVRCTILLCTLAGSTLSSNVYTTNSLETFCYKDGAKREVAIFNKPHMYVFNSTVSTTFKCHLELEQQSRISAGFSVYIQSMDFIQDEECSRDYVQFGKDVLFITTSKSKKFCGHIPPPVQRLNGELHAGFEPDIHTEKRKHKEDSTLEMDVWIKIEGGGRKELVLIITPHSMCSRRSTGTRPCPNSSECISSELFCDGKVNCISNSLDEDSRFCPHLEAGGLTESPIGIPLILIICVVLVVFITFTFFAVKEGLKRMKGMPGPRPDRSVQDQLPAGQQLLSCSAPPPDSCGDLPPFPPSYAEAVGQFSEPVPKQLLIVL